MSRNVLKKTTGTHAQASNSSYQVFHLHENALMIGMGILFQDWSQKNDIV